MNEKVVATKAKITQALTDLKDVKQKMVGGVEQIGSAESYLKIASEVLSEIGDSNVPEAVEASGVTMSVNVAQSTGDLVKFWAKPLGQLDNRLGTISDSSQYLAGVAMSGATLSQPSIPLETLNKYQDELDTVRERFSVEKQLEKIEPHLAEMYANVWKTKNYLDKDKDRQPSANMREIIGQVLRKYAPDSEVKAQIGFIPDPTSKSGITRPHRVNLIVQKINDAQLGQQLQAMANDYFDLIQKLNQTVHFPGGLVEKETTNDLYRADSLLRLLLRCVSTI